MFSVILPTVVTTAHWRGQQKTALQEETVDCFTFEIPLWYEGGKLKRIFLLFVLKGGIWHSPHSPSLEIRLKCCSLNNS